MNLGDFVYPEDVAKAIDEDVTEHDDPWIDVMQKIYKFTPMPALITMGSFIGVIFFAYKLIVMLKPDNKGGGGPAVKKRE